MARRHGSHQTRTDAVNAVRCGIRALTMKLMLNYNNFTFVIDFL